jgi:hemerythrin-like domain-containing protein
MEAIQNLMAEHRLILRAVDALEAFARDAGRGVDEREELGRFVTFIRGYADKLHHGKEEEVIFVAMVDAGFSRDQGPIAVMLQDHDVGREHVSILAGLAASVVPWTREDLEILQGAGRAYAELLRAHIQKEDRILYPMAEQRLSPDVQAQVDAACAALDATAGRDGTRGRLEQLGADLAARHVSGLGAGLPA